MVMINVCYKVKVINYLKQGRIRLQTGCLSIKLFCSQIFTQI